MFCLSFRRGKTWSRTSWTRLNRFLLPIWVKKRWRQSSGEWSRNFFPKITGTSVRSLPDVVLQKQFKFWAHIHVFKTLAKVWILFVLGRHTKALVLYTFAIKNILRCDVSLVCNIAWVINRPLTSDLFLWSEYTNRMQHVLEVSQKWTCVFHQCHLRLICKMH